MWSANFDITHHPTAFVTWLRICVVIRLHRPYRHLCVTQYKIVELWSTKNRQSTSTRVLTYTHKWTEVFFSPRQNYLLLISSSFHVCYSCMPFVFTYSVITFLAAFVLLFVQLFRTTQEI